ncbi:hypothetical protein MHSWG343_09340 [Candidatus Mycoplasma haematohominis]|uniref:Uncharacterized protein n=1 Tax=Candidatus Mycoplasma haematohominis TaxID=1494318 RepID=A0A478FRV1_9MOLU|nr:hypothetical protein MHSWG343_09340 [Candidatus Mycoplasma haemohominis]
MSTLAYVGSAIAGTVAISLATAYALGAFDYKYENFLKYATGNGFVYIGDKGDDDSNSVKNLLEGSSSNYKENLGKKWLGMSDEILEEDVKSSSPKPPYSLESNKDKIVKFVEAWCQAISIKPTPTPDKKNWTEKEIKADKDWAAFEAVCLIKK